MMRRCLNEALAAAQSRIAFGHRVSDYPLMRRQLMKLKVPTEQALSMALCTADALRRSAADELRILTDLLKLRACHGAIAVATGAMEARGGNGYIEDWVNPRLIRDAPLGAPWEGTSNINALDVIGRAVRKDRAHLALQSLMYRRLQEARSLQPLSPAAVAQETDRCVARADRAAESVARQAATALYNAASAVLLAWEASQPHADAGRALLARFVLAHRLSPRAPLALGKAPWEQPAADCLLLGTPARMTDIAPLQGGLTARRWGRHPSRPRPWRPCRGADHRVRSPDAHIAGRPNSRTIASN